MGNGSSQSKARRPKAAVLAEVGSNADITLSQGTDCFLFDSVINSYAPILGANTTGAYMFCDSIPFMMTNAFMSTQGNCLTENKSSEPPNLAPPAFASEAPGAGAWMYEFVRGSSGQILIFASDGMEGMGWLTFKANAKAFNQQTSFLLPSQASVEALGVSFGVVYNPSVSTQKQVFIAYTDTASKGATSLMTCVGGNAAGVIPGDSLGSASGTTWMYHGLYSTPSQSFQASNYLYWASTMSLDPNFLAGSKLNINYVTWVLQVPAGALTSGNVGNYMNRICMGVIEDPVNCSHGRGACTAFTHLSPRGLSCGHAAEIDGTVTNAAFATLCGIDPITKTVASSTPAANSPVMLTNDCTCLNYTQSPLPQTGLPLNQSYSAFQKWLISKNVPFHASGNTMCWLPSCAPPLTPGGSTSGILTYTNPATYTGKCPNSLYCIAAITAEVENGGSISAATSNQCSQSTSNSGAPARPAAPKHASPFVKSKGFEIAAATVAMLIVAFVAYYIFKPSGKPQIQYVVLE